MKSTIAVFTQPLAGLFEIVVIVFSATREVVTFGREALFKWIAVRMRNQRRAAIF